MKDCSPGRGAVAPDDRSSATPRRSVKDAVALSPRARPMARGGCGAEAEQTPHVTVPGLVGGLVQLRAGDLCPTRAIVATRDPTGDTFPAIDDVRYWDLRVSGRSPFVDRFALPLAGPHPPTGHTLGALARAALAGSLLRDYLSTWYLARDRQADKGLFALDTRTVLLDLYGLKPHVTTAKGKRYARPSVDALAAYRANLAALGHVYVYGIGPVESSHGQPLITVYRHHVRPDRQLYVHSDLAWRMVRASYTQIPRAVFRLHADEVPLALGVAHLWRVYILGAVLRGPGLYRTTLQALATEVGEPWEAGAHERGPGVYWPRFAARCAAVMAAADLGVFALHGEGPAATVTLTPSDALVRVYGPLRAASDRAAECEAEARRARAAQRLDPARRRRGRGARGPR
jgi:hypothetical protein